MAAPAIGPISGIDHTLVGVRDLEAARATWRHLGFTVTPRGRHIGWGTGNYCIMFPGDYVELLGIVDPGQFLNRLDTLLETRGEGFLGLAFSAPDPDAVHLAHPDVTGPPKDLGRLLELPEGTVTPRFSLVHFKPEATPGLSAFCCTHLTPGLLRRPDWLDHANGAIGLEGVTVPAEDPAALAPAYEALFGPASLHAGRGRLDIRAGTHDLRFVAPDRLARRYPGLEPAPVMTVLCRDLAETGAYLGGQGIATAEAPGARIVVPPDQANGVILEFAVS
ncbi:VOC family protein [Skermanella rosea]|uniref:VOC family protein n=1 Tax=Skermanella rosea TaxID=1817965 RepID=UPI001932428F|nr:VOC family protein [Skermanella rosea]UEM04648.1 VOC family protein [Skermanella rosea]